MVNGEGEVANVAPPVLPRAEDEALLDAGGHRYVVEAGAEPPHGLGVDDAQRLQDAVDEQLQVLGLLEVARVDERLAQRVAAAQPDAAFAARPQQHRHQLPRVQVLNRLEHLQRPATANGQRPLTRSIPGCPRCRVAAGPTGGVSGLLEVYLVVETEVQPQAVPESHV